MVIKSLKRSLKYLHSVACLKISSLKVLNFRHLLGCGTSLEKQLKRNALGAQSITRGI